MWTLIRPDRAEAIVKANIFRDTARKDRSGGYGLCRFDFVKASGFFREFGSI